MLVARDVEAGGGSLQIRRKTPEKDVRLQNRNTV
jgi:hypothetical protein